MNLFIEKYNQPQPHNEENEQASSYGLTPSGGLHHK